MPDLLYDSIGRSYTKTRRADERIASFVEGALDLRPGSRLIDIGAGTGKYALWFKNRGYQVIPVEPSQAMIAQCEDPSLPFIQASAETLPDILAEGAFAILSIHHWSDLRQGLANLRRAVKNGPITVFTFNPHAFGRLWLADYFPSIGSEVETPYNKITDLAHFITSAIGGNTVKSPFLLPADLSDQFGAANWRYPERYLDPSVRAGISSFSLLPSDVVETGLRRLESDLSDGSWDARYGSLRAQDCLDAGYACFTNRPD